jgi:hypothetical protein
MNWKHYLIGGLIAKLLLTFIIISIIWIYIKLKRIRNGDNGKRINQRIIR